MLMPHLKGQAAIVSLLQQRPSQLWRARSREQGSVPRLVVSFTASKMSTVDR